MKGAFAGLGLLGAALVKKPVARRIVDYLRKHGAMSGWDIVNDLGVSEIDVEMARQAGIIVQVSPPHGGVSPWFALPGRGLGAALMKKGTINPESRYMKKVVLAYLEAALWSSTDEDDEPLDEYYNISDISSESVQKAGQDVEKFIDQAGGLLDNIAPDSVGHDFWLTRNGHGTGFWDRGYGSRGDRLTDIAHSFGEQYMYVGDDGKVYLG